VKAEGEEEEGRHMEALRRGQGWRGEGGWRERREDRAGATTSAKVPAADAASRLCRSYTTCCMLVPASNEEEIAREQQHNSSRPVIASWC
jgi:hypothetical protein